MNRRSFILSSIAALLSAPMAGYSLSAGSKIRIGMIGTRHAHASGKIKAIRDQSDTFELVGVVENDPVIVGVCLRPTAATTHVGLGRQAVILFMTPMQHGPALARDEPDIQHVRHVRVDLHDSQARERLIRDANAEDAGA